jgi:hypothetical protein
MSKPIIFCFFFIQPSSIKSISINEKQKIGILHVNYLFNKTFLIDSTNMLYREGFYIFVYVQT